MELIKKTITCQYCKNVYSNPIFLPCFNTICENHIDELVKDKKTNLIKCFFCNQEHEKPDEGFKTNQMAKDVINSNSYLTEEEKEAKIELEIVKNQLDRFVDEYAKIETQTDAYISDYFSRIRAKIETQRSYLKLKIDKLADKLVNESNQVEIKHKQVISEIRDANNNQFDKDGIRKLKKELANHLKLPELNLELLDELRIQINEHVLGLKEKLDEFEKVKQKTNDCIFESDEENFVFGEISFSQDYKLISCSADSTIKVWDLVKGQCKRTLYGHKLFVYAVQMLKSGLLASCSLDRTIKIWDVKSETCVRTFADSSFISCIKQTSDDVLMSGSFEGYIKLWDLESGVCKRTIKAHLSLLTALELLENGQVASCSYDRTVKIWDLESGVCLKMFEGHTHFINCLKALPNNQLASGSADKTIKIWDLESGNYY